MAGYLPPIEDLPIFDESVFRAGDAPLTYNEALKKFLRYPNAQGKEFLQEIEVDGTSVFNENIVVNNNSSITSNGDPFVTSITPSLISTTETAGFGDPLDTIIQPNNMIMHNGNANNQTNTVTASSVYIVNADTASTTEMSALGLTVVDTNTNETVLIHPNQIELLTTGVGTSLSLTSETISNVANIQNLKSEVTQYLDIKSGLDIAGNTWQGEIYMQKQNVSISTNNTSQIVNLQDGGVFGGYTVTPGTWDYQNGTLPADNWSLLPNGSVNIGQQITFRDVVNGTTADIIKSLNDLSINGTTNSDNISFHIGTKTALRLGFGNSTFDNNVTNVNANWNINNTSGQGSFVNLVASGTQPGSGDNSTAVPTTSWVQSRITTLLGSANFWSGGSQTFSTGANIPAGANLNFIGAGNTQARISPATTPQNNLQINLQAGTTAEPLYLNNPGGVFTGTAINVGTAFGYSTGSSLFQNMTGATAPLGFTFSSMTSTVANKILGIIPYTQPASNDNSQNLATTAWVQTMTSPLLSLNNTWTGTNNFTNTTTVGTLKFGALGTSPSIVANSSEILASVSSQGTFRINVTTSNASIPTANANNGISFAFNASGGGGESVIVNYANFGTGGFDFYTVNSTTNGAKIATISPTEPALNDATTKLATTKWSTDALAPIVASLSTTRVVAVSVPNYTYTTNCNNLYNAYQNFGIVDAGSTNIINWIFINGVVNTTYKIFLTIGAGGVLANKPTGVLGNLLSNLAGTTNLVAGSKWVIQTTFDGTTYYMNWTNYT